MGFDRVIERRGTRSVKWDGMRMFLGRDDLLPLWVADMDFEAPAAVRTALVEAAERGIYGYSMRGDEFNRAIAGWFASRHGWTLAAEWICPTPGVVPAVNAAIRAFSRPGGGVVVQTPAYYPFFGAVTGNGRTLLRSPLQDTGRGYVMDLDDLDRKLAAADLLILCHPHNPVGRVWNRDELAAVAELARCHEVMIVSDDIHCDIVLEGCYQPLALIEPDLASRVVTCLSPSKTFGLAGLNTAFAVVSDPGARRRLTRELARGGFHWGTIFGDAALIAAYEHGGPWLEELLGVLRSNLGLVIDALGDLPGVRVLPLEGTYLAWIDLRGTGLDEAELGRLLLEEAKVGLEKGSDFGPEGAGYQRLNFATPRALLSPGLERMRAVLAGAGAREGAPGGAVP